FDDALALLLEAGRAHAKLARRVRAPACPDRLVDRGVEANGVGIGLEVLGEMLADERHRSIGTFVVRARLHFAERHGDDALLEVLGAHSSVSLRRQLRRLGLRIVSRSVFMMTHAGTREFCRSSFPRRFFFAFEFLLMVGSFPPRRLNPCPSVRRSVTTRIARRWYSRIRRP